MDAPWVAPLQGSQVQHPRPGRTRQEPTDPRPGPVAEATEDRDASVLGQLSDGAGEGWAPRDPGTVLGSQLEDAGGGGDGVRPSRGWLAWLLGSGAAVQRRQRHVEGGDASDFEDETEEEELDGGSLAADGRELSVVGRMKSAINGEIARVRKVQAPSERPSLGSRC